MTSLRWICFGFTVFLAIAVLVGHVPMFQDAEGRTFGIFRLNLFQDLLHTASALWALAAGLTSHRAAKFFLTYFGILYFADGLMGVVTGSGYLDLGIIRNGWLDQPLSFKILASTPHLFLGGVGLLASRFFDSKRA
ncbi:DUF4383 domain-containing protein [Aestuariivirga litoralis]|uniref:DUF4383 domain-containing protein n=1 Tax=Aestuariivirga litoralis TaxID=2650924 RepID=UPI0018C62FC9|nr:DUF4383 domain-containing protein [Aestuariivirga litoralis]MBG1232562.1 DUF4383 domain-containing protein [Aestuariivirga litoralis]